MTSRRWVWILTAMILGMSPLVGHAQDAGPGIGDWVATRLGTEVITGSSIIDDIRAELSQETTWGELGVYQVQFVYGPWLWVVSSKLSGWVDSSDVAPLDQALEESAEWIRDNPFDPRPHALRGIIYMEKEEYDRAAAEYSEVIRLGPTNALAFNARGVAWRSKKDYDRAMADFNEAIRLKPDYLPAYIDRGLIQDIKGEYNRAIADFDEALRLDPTLAPVYSNRGTAWQHKKEYDRTLADFNRAIRLKPNHPAQYFNRALTWKAKKEYGRTLADYDTAIHLDPKNPYLILSRASLWATCPEDRYRDGKKAVESATQGCEMMRWNDAWALETLAAASAEAGDLDAAVRWQTRALELLPEDDEQLNDSRARLDLYRSGKPFRDTDESTVSASITRTIE